MNDKALSREDLDAVQGLASTTEGLSEKQFVEVTLIDADALHEEAHRILDGYATAAAKGEVPANACAPVQAALMVGILAERQRQARVAEPPEVNR